MDLRKKCHELLDDPEEGLEAAGPEFCILGSDDLGEDFARSIMDSCYTRPDTPKED